MNRYFIEDKDNCYALSISGAIEGKDIVSAIPEYTRKSMAGMTVNKDNGVRCLKTLCGAS